MGHTKLSEKLRANLLAVVGGTATADELNGVVAVCHALASSFLSSKSSTGLLVRAQGLSLGDLAYDCIAELFRQDAAGAYVQLEAYFGGIAIASISEEELLAHLRRLVFSKVNHGVFRLYNEADPSLARILRNIKLTIQSLGQWTESERFGEPCIAPGLCDTLEHLPAFDREELEAALAPEVTGNELIPEMLGKLSRLLRGQNRRARIVPLVGAAMVFRSCFESKAVAASPVATEDRQDHSFDIHEAVRRACRDVQRELAPKYVGREKVTAEIFGVYFEVIASELCEHYPGDGQANASLYAILSSLRPEISREEYVGVHRNRIEYLLKIVRRKTARALKSG